MPAMAAASLLTPKFCNIAVYPPGATFGPRRMRDYELVWMIEGAARYQRRWPDGRQEAYEAPPNSVVLCQPGVIDSFIWDPHRTTRHGYVHFDLPNRRHQWPPQHDWPMVRALEADDVFRPMFRHLLAWAKVDPVLSAVTLTHLFTAYVTGRLATAALPSGRLPEPVERAMRHLYASLDADASLAVPFDQMVRASGVTASHLCRLFSKTIGVTPAQTIKLARLDRAVTLLAHSNYSIKEIAIHCGFSTPFLFSRQFKQAYGLAPVELRRQMAMGRTPPPSRLHVHALLDQ